MKKVAFANFFQQCFNLHTRKYKIFDKKYEFERIVEYFNILNNNIYNNKNITKALIINLVLPDFITERIFHLKV